MLKFKVRPNVDQTIHPNDRLWPHYKDRENYFRSAEAQVVFLKEVVCAHRIGRWWQRLSIADYACHYGRLTRALAVVFPRARLFAYDIDPQAIAFCAERFRATPIQIGWLEAGDQWTAPSGQHGLLVCVSLLTHTKLEYSQRVIGYWSRCIRRGGLLVFTYFGASLLERWASQGLGYGDGSPQQRAEVRSQFARTGHGFKPETHDFSSAGDYGMGFLETDLVKELCRSSGFHVERAIAHDKGSLFGQDVIVAVRK